MSGSIFRPNHYLGRHYGEKGGFTAMAKSVGLPAGIATKLILTNKLPLTGCHIPTHPAIFVPILKGLAENGLTFEESVEKL